MAIADVTVMGGGIFGLAVGYCCALRGARVQLIERRQIGWGASGGQVGALAPHVPDRWNEKKQFQFESLVLARRFWPEVEARTGRSTGYGRIGRLQPLPDIAAVERARDRAMDARRHWGDAAQWRLRPVAELGVWCPPSASGWILADDLSARIDPARATHALAAALRALGGRIIEGAGVTAPEPARTGAVVWATGHEGLAELSLAFGRMVGTGVKGQSLRLAAGMEKAPQIYAESLHLVPHDDGTVAIGSTTEREFDDGRATDTALDALLSRAVALMPTLGGAPVVARWAGVRPRAASRAPILGPWPGRPGHFIANGGFKIGLGMAPKVGAAMADLLLEGRDAIPAGFRPEACGIHL